MANLRDVRLRMRAITQILQVTKAMNLISTAKLRRGRRLLEDTEPYFNRIQKSMRDIVSGTGQVQSDFIKRNNRNEKGHSAVVVITSDRGLAGGYNANVFRYVSNLCSGLSNPVLLLIGAVGFRYFAHSPYTILESFSFKSRLPEVEDAQEIADFIISQYLWGVFDEVHVAYTRMHSTIKLLPESRQILPLDAQGLLKDPPKGGPPVPEKRGETSFEYLPSEEAVFDALVPLYLKGVIYGALIEGYVSEQSARMAAMDEASKSAEEMLSSLRIHYNRVRQAGITQEVTEIISGSAALLD